MNLVDPTPALEAIYAAEVAKLIERLGAPATRADRRRLAAAQRSLRREIFMARAPGIASW